jgi:hypothetical protein
MITTFEILWYMTGIAVCLELMRNDTKTGPWKYLLVPLFALIWPAFLFKEKKWL